jgi:hypothetical protein
VEQPQAVGGLRQPRDPGFSHLPAVPLNKS